MRVHLRLCACAFTRVFVCGCVYADVRASVYVCAYAYARLRTPIYACIYIYSYGCKCPHTCKQQPLRCVCVRTAMHTNVRMHASNSMHVYVCAYVFSMRVCAHDCVCVKIGILIGIDTSYVHAHIQIHSQPYRIH